MCQVRRVDVWCYQVIFDPQSPGGTIDRASSITPGTSSDEASTLDGAITGIYVSLGRVRSGHDVLVYRSGRAYRYICKKLTSLKLIVRTI